MPFVSKEHRAFCSLHNLKIKSASRISRSNASECDDKKRYFEREIVCKERTPPFFCFKVGRVQKAWSFQFWASHASETCLSYISLHTKLPFNEGNRTSFKRVQISKASKEWKVFFVRSIRECGGKHIDTQTGRTYRALHWKLPPAIRMVTHLYGVWIQHWTCSSRVDKR